MRSTTAPATAVRRGEARTLRPRLPRSGPGEGAVAPVVSRLGRDLDHGVGRFDDRGGQRAWLEVELVHGLARHQRHDAVGAGLQLDLGGDLVLYDTGDDAGK